MLDEPDLLIYLLVFGGVLFVMWENMHYRK